MRILVTAASRHGSTHEIAATIAETLRAEGLDVDLRDVADVGDIGRYDVVVMGSAVYMGKWLPEARRFAQRHRQHLSVVPVWLFSSGPLGLDDPRPKDDPSKLIASLPPMAIHGHRVFVGKLAPAGLGRGERLLVKIVHAPAGDFRDWDEIRAWAREIVADLQPARDSVDS